MEILKGVSMETVDGEDVGSGGDELRQDQTGKYSSPTKPAMRQ